MRRDNNANPGRPLRLEVLEARLPLAGMVIVQFGEGNSLYIQGDANDNHIRLALENGQIVVSSLDGSTQINSPGQYEFAFDSNLLQRGLSADMLDGNDTLQIGGEAHDTPAPAGDSHTEDDHEEPRLFVPGDVVVSTGAGEDTTRISFIEIQGSLFVDTAADDDIVNIGRGPGFGHTGHDGNHDEHLVMDGRQSVSGSEPSCDDHGDKGPPPDVHVGQGIWINTGPGEDRIKIAFAEVGESLRLQSGPGDDFVVTGRGPIHDQHGGGGGGCEEAVSLSASHDGGDGHAGGRPADFRVASDARVDLGPGDDFAMLRNMLVSNNLDVTASAGDNTIGTQNVRVMADTSIQTRAGDDIVALLDSRFAGLLSVRMGAGVDLLIVDGSESSHDAAFDMGSFDDLILITESEFQASVALNGGAGTDRGSWEASENSFFESPLVNSFEDVFPVDPNMVKDLVELIFAGFLQGRA